MNWNSQANDGFDSAPAGRPARANAPRRQARGNAPLRQARGNARLDARVDAGLRRAFTPPPELVFEPRPAVERSSPGPGGALFAARWLVAAGVLVGAGLLLWRAGDTLPGQPVDPTLELAAAELVPTLGRPERPDLAQLYEEIFGIPEPVAACEGVRATEVLSTGVTNTLASRCGSSIDLDPESASMLAGPFPSIEWPSGTVLAGYPDGPEGPPVVIVAECADYQDCCIQLDAFASAGLQHFSTQCNGVVLTEITPHAEPRMLGRLAVAH